MSKISILPIKGGHAASAGSGYGAESISGIYSLNIPQGFVFMDRLVYREDDVIRPPYASGVALGNAPGGTVLAVLNDGTDILYAITSDSDYTKVYKSADAGATWSTAYTFTAGEQLQTPAVTQGTWTIADLGTNVCIKNNSTSDCPIFITPGTTAWKFLSTTLKGYCVCAHENRLLVGGCLDSGTGGRNRIYYSDVGLYETNITTNYVNVGSASDAVRFMYDINGGLVVVKEHSIWMKTTTYEDGITSAQFHCVASGMSTPKDARVFNNVLYIFNSEGVFAFSGGDLRNISTIVKGNWNFSHDWRLGYWQKMNWLYCVDITPASSQAYILDLNKGRWMHDTVQWTNFGGNVYTNICFYTDGTTIPKQLTDATSVKAGTLRIPFNNLGSPQEEKYLRRLLIDYKSTGTLDVKIYGRKADGTISTLYDSTV